MYPINLDRSVLVNSRNRTINKNSPEAPLFFQSVVNGVFTLEGQPKAPDHVFKAILDLMTRSSEIHIGKYRLNPMEVLSFLGRALFFRFLWDRRIVQSSEFPSVCPQAESLEDCFCNVRTSVETCRWLDETSTATYFLFPVVIQTYSGRLISKRAADYFSTCWPF